MTADAVQALADRAAITDVLVRYAEGLDRRDLEAVRSCFASEVHAEYAGVVLDPGVDALIEHVSIVSTFAGSMHLLGNVVVDVDGDEARSTCRCVAYVLREADEGVRLFMRGLTYEDRWARTPDGFHITHRRHVPEWSVEAPVELFTASHLVPSYSLHSSEEMVDAFELRSYGRNESRGRSGARSECAPGRTKIPKG